MRTLGESIVDWLEAYGIDTVFGIPGVHTVELYRGMARSSIRHVTPRHEQGAGFMADGYYRATGRIAAAFVITGPGLTNILTPMAQAYADSIPMLVISSVNRTSALGMGGDLHEIRNQGLIAAQAAAFSHTITDPGQLPEVMRRAWAVFGGARPRPVHIQVPVDLLGAAAGSQVPPEPIKPVFQPQPFRLPVVEAAEYLREADAPLILAGGGAVAPGGSEMVRGLAERLGAPVVMTTNGRGLVSVQHPLAVPASPSLQAVRDLIADADCVLAVGTEFGRTDYDMDDRSDLEVPGQLLRIDIDPEQVLRGPSPDLALVGDAAASVAAINGVLGKGTGRPDGPARAAAARSVAMEEIGPKYRAVLGFLESIRDTLPEAPIVCDSTQAAYAGNLYYGAPAPWRWFNAATGYGSLGYGLPAAIGASFGLRLPWAGIKGAEDGVAAVVCIAGDGGLQFSLSDLGTAVEEKLPVILLIWNNRGYGEIKQYMVAREIAPVGVDLHTPDFVGIGQAYGAVALRLERLDDLPGLLRAAAGRSGPTLIEVDEAVVLGR